MSHKVQNPTPDTQPPRARLRDLGISIGNLQPGLLNAITDVPGVLVGHTTVIQDTPVVMRTGVTVILAREAIHSDHTFAGYDTLNGMGELTGMHWVEESGLLGVPIALTGSLSLGSVYDALCTYTLERGGDDGFMPIVGETWDGWLSTPQAGHVTRSHVAAALAAARSGPVAEGNVGGGTGMVCHGFKGGIGTSSRVAGIGDSTYTVGALVQANYGRRSDLLVNGTPVGRAIGPEVTPLPEEGPKQDGSIIMIVATDAPLLGDQCKRMAKRAALGLARVGGYGYNPSGDIALAFATGNHMPAGATAPYDIRTLPQHRIDPLLVATVESVEEAILNALCAAETMTGFSGRVAHALPLDVLQRVLGR